MISLFVIIKCPAVKLTIKLAVALLSRPPASSELGGTNVYVAIINHLTPFNITKSECKPFYVQPGESSGCLLGTASCPSRKQQLAVGDLFALRIHSFVLGTAITSILSLGLNGWLLTEQLNPCPPWIFHVVREQTVNGKL